MATACQVKASGIVAVDNRKVYDTSSPSAALPSKAANHAHNAGPLKANRRPFPDTDVIVLTYQSDEPLRTGRHRTFDRLIAATVAAPLRNICEHEVISDKPYGPIVHRITPSL